MLKACATFTAALHNTLILRRFFTQPALRTRKRRAHDKRIGALLALVTFDKGHALGQGGGCTKDGSCLAVKRAFTMMYQAAVSMFTMNAAVGSSRKKLTLHDIAKSSLRWPPLARAVSKGAANQNARGRCFGVSRGSTNRPYCSVPNEYRKLVPNVIAA